MRPCFLFCLRVQAPYRVLYGTDFQGRACGTGDNAGKTNVFYPQLSLDLSLQVGIDVVGAGVSTCAPIVPE